jgi:glycosyltransferase involved in cell wall biosynthesis
MKDRIDSEPQVVRQPPSTPTTTTEQRLRVLMVAATAIHGGHVVQMEKTAEALEGMGHEVAVADATAARVTGWDIVHAFGAPWRFRHVLREARQAGSTVVISPIMWPYRSARTVHGRIWSSSIRTARVTSSALRRGIDETAAELRRPSQETAMALELADLVLPNSTGEAERIRSTFGVTTPIHVVPNGFDPRLFSPPDIPGQRDGVVCVARIEPHKNQLELIEALRGSGIPLTILGDEHPHHRAYAARCRVRADANIAFRSAVSHAALVGIYRRAAVHVLPSWFETTGLVSLEAAACGCAVVTTARGDAAEYFGDLARYCNPSRRRSIRAAVEEALSTGAPLKLSEHVRENFTWEHAARATLDAYGIIRCHIPATPTRPSRSGSTRR